jgi:hypothetical protein
MSCFPILETRWLNGTDAKVAANGDAYAGHQRGPLHHCGRSLKARLSARCMTMSSKWLFVGKQPESLAGSGILPQQTHTRSTAVARCVRSLFLSPEILSLSQPGRMPLAALQIAFRILFHLVPPSHAILILVVRLSVRSRCQSTPAIALRLAFHICEMSPPRDPVAGLGRMSARYSSHAPI